MGSISVPCWAWKSPARPSGTVGGLLRSKCHNLSTKRGRACVFPTLGHLAKNGFLALKDIWGPRVTRPISNLLKGPHILPQPCTTLLSFTAYHPDSPHFLPPLSCQCHSVFLPFMALAKVSKSLLLNKSKPGWLYQTLQGRDRATWVSGAASSTAC